MHLEENFFLVVEPPHLLKSDQLPGATILYYLVERGSINSHDRFIEPEGFEDGQPEALGEAGKNVNAAGFVRDPDQVNGFGKQFGRTRGGYWWYHVQRLHPENGNFLLIEKMYLKAPGVHYAIWAIRIKIFDSPPYPGELFLRGKRGA
jgi:hypothetical protein